MNKLEEAFESSWYQDCYNGNYKDVAFTGFKAGAEWQSKQSPWIDINDRSVTMPNDKGCLLRLENGVIVRDTEEWEGVYPFLVTHWMEIPSFDGILESNKDVLNRMKEKGD